jgi:hypothetical protein
MEAVAAMTATEEPVRESVRSWMTKAGAQCVDWNSALRCTAPAKAIEEAFKTELHEFDQVRAPGARVWGAVRGRGAGCVRVGSPTIESCAYHLSASSSRPPPAGGAAAPPPPPPLPAPRVQVDTKTGSLVRTIHRVPNDIEFSLPQELAVSVCGRRRGEARRRWSAARL